jgi:hypothetical protein
MTVFRFPRLKGGRGFSIYAKGTAYWKLTISIDQENDLLPIGATPQELRQHHDKSYLLVGGLGGLGRAISTWLVERRARHLIYLSRSAGKSDEDHEFFRELHCQGCTTQVVSGV